MEIRQVKREIRILGVDDARFERGRDQWTRLVGVVFRGGEWMEGCVQVPIQVDGDDVTTRLIDMVKTSSHYGQLRLIMTRDTIFGGVNVLDLPGLVEATKLPVIAVSDSKPDMSRVKKALRQIDPDAWEEKLSMLTESGPIREVESRAGRSPVYLQWAGLPFEQAVEVVQKTATHSRIPEPIRVAHLFASSFVPE
ncbi:MAG: endonuclease dU [Candidatus Hermodarchaeia archaeon]|jgi:endonuclease V-like protein UPF0215 family